MITINLSDLPRTNVTPRITVYTKATWDDPFVVNEQLMVQQSRWSTAPSVSSAVLQYRFGQVILPGKSQAQTVAPITTRGYWVLIRYETAFQPDVWWLGYADSPITVQRFKNESSGIQEIPCWGLERAMQYGEINTVAHKNPDPAADGSDDKPFWLRKEQSTFFNPTRPGNRIKDEVVVSSDDAPTEIKRYVFSNPGEDDPQFWSTREIFQHLTSFHLPTNDYGVGKIPFAAHADAGGLPNWDQVSLNTEGMSLHTALTELLTEERLLGWCLEPEVQINFLTGVPTVSNVFIRPFTRTGEPINLPSIGKLPANTNTIAWIDSGDDLTDSELQTDDSEEVDQVIVKGPREIAVGTFGSDTEWVKDWEDEDTEDEDGNPVLSLETQYKDAYKDHPNWSNLKLYEKRELNDYFRSLPRFRNVFSRYKIDDNWNGKCRESNLFLKALDEDGEEDPDVPIYIPYLGAVELLDELPLFRGVNYADKPADEVDETKGHQPMPIVALIKDPANDNYRPLQDVHSAYGTPAIRNPNRLDYQVGITADNIPGPAFRISISGAPRHALFQSFVGNDADPEKINPKIWGTLSISDMEITAAMRGGRRPQWAIPEIVNSDLTRRRIITLDHPGLQHVHIAADTVLGVDAEGALIVSPGGVLRDPLPTIRALCIIAAKSLGEPRRHFHARTARVLPEIKVGRIIKTHNGTVADTVIREVIISSPIVEDDSPPPIITTILATNSQADIASLVGRVPEPEPQQ